MSDVWLTSSLHIKKVNFHWKIENFHHILRNFGKTGFDSPELNIVSSDGKTHSVKLRFVNCLQNQDINKISVAGEEKSGKDYTLINVLVVNTTSSFELAGTLDMDIEGIKFYGEFGNPDQEVLITNQVHNNRSKQNMANGWMFKNKIHVQYENPHTQQVQQCSGFCVANATKTLKISVQLTTLVPREEMVKDSGPTKLLADLNSLLNRAHEYKSDFSIICSGKSFPCH